jgi:hypothetical protein
METIIFYNNGGDGSLLFQPRLYRKWDQKINNTLRNNYMKLFGKN